MTDMSFRHVLYVMNDERFRGLKPSSRLLLVALAACASDRGNVCWPSQTWLMTATGMARATLYRAKGPIRDLIEIDPPGYKRSNCYYFPPVDVKGRRLTDVAKVLEAKREQELEAKGELAESVDNVSITCSKSQNETGEGVFSGLKMRPQGSQNETGGGLKLRPEYKDESIKKSGGQLLSQNETSQNETAKEYDGSRAPNCKSDYEWIRRHCRLAGMDDAHTAQFLAKHRPWGWNALKPGVNVCDLIADFVTVWKERSMDEWKYVQDCIKNGVL